MRKTLAAAAKWSLITPPRWSLFTPPLTPEWRVVSVARRNDGLTYATLVMTRDPSERKMLAIGALMDRRMYGLVADAPTDEMGIPE